MDLLFNNYMRSSGNGDTWHVDIDAPTRKVGTYFEETIKTMEYVYANKTGDIYVMYSGGMDSEYVCNILIHMGIKFTPVIIKLSPNYNPHDLHYAFEFCKSTGLDPLVIDFNFDEFVNSGEIVEMAEKMRSCSFRMPATMKVISQLDGFVMLGNDPPYMRLNTTTNTWQLEEEEVIHSILTFYKDNHIAGCPFFLSYTPEMMLSFLLDPTMKKLAHHGIPGKLGTNTSKVHVFNNGSGFEMQNRKKYTGYEYIFISPIYHHPNIQLIEATRNKWNGCYKEDYDSVVKRLLLNQFDN